MTLDECATASVACSASTCRSSPRQGLARMRCAASTGRTPGRPNYRAGRVLLLGDAAHVHSPMGGPGLNLGMQEPSTSAGSWRPCSTAGRPIRLLDTYESERYPVGERVMMHSLAQIALSAPGPEVAALRELFGELARQPQVAGHLADLLAGSDVRYDVGDDHPLSGLMVPDLTLDDGRRVADLLHEARPVLLDLSGGRAASGGGRGPTAWTR